MLSSRNELTKPLSRVGDLGRFGIRVGPRPKEDAVLGRGVSAVALSLEDLCQLVMRKRVARIQSEAIAQDARRLIAFAGVSVSACQEMTVELIEVCGPIDAEGTDQRKLGKGATRLTSFEFKIGAHQNTSYAVNSLGLIRPPRKISEFTVGGIQ